MASGADGQAIVRGFLASGEAFVWQMRPQTRYLKWNPETGLTYELPPLQEGVMRMAPMFRDKGELDGLVALPSGSVAIYRLKSQAWVQISPKIARYCDFVSANAKGSLACNVKLKPNGPFECLLIEDERVRNLTRELRRPDVRALALLDDGRLILHEPSGPNATSFLLLDRGVLSILGVFNRNPGETSTFFADKERLLVFAENSDLRSPSVVNPTTIIGAGSSQTLKGPAGLELSKVSPGPAGWYGGLEPPTGELQLPRSVLVVDGRAHYVDDLVANRQELMTTKGFQGRFTSPPVFGGQGLIIVSGPARLAVGGSAHKHYILRPTTY